MDRSPARESEMEEVIPKGGPFDEGRVLLPSSRVYDGIKPVQNLMFAPSHSMNE